MKRVLFFFFLFDISFSLEIESLLIGAEDGIYIKNTKAFEKLEILEGKRIIQITGSPFGFYFLCDEGVAFSSDLMNVQWLTNGFMKNRIMVEENGKFFVKEDFERFNAIKIDERAPQNLIVYNKKEIYLSTNYGKSWKKLIVPLKEFNSVEISSSKNEITLYFTHPYKGVYFYSLSKKRFVNYSYGLERFNAFYEDLSDINFVNGELTTVSAFKKDVYGFDFNSLEWEKLFNIDGEQIGMVYCFDQFDGGFVFLTDSSIKIVKDDKVYDFELLYDILNYFFEEKKVIPYSVFINNQLRLTSIDVLFNDRRLNKNFLKAINKKGLYISPVAIKRKGKNLKYFFSLVEEKGCNAMVFDMKDDFGYLHFVPESPEIKKIAKVVNPIDIKSLVKGAKERDIYLIARLVVFKDPVLYRYKNGKYAVKDKKTGTPWVGLKTNKSETGIETNEIKEYWVDPYNPEVWKYNVAIARELVQKGFDEIQFDYIRFPTDGLNLKSAFYPGQISGITKDEAIFSFLRYARKNITAPISIDIYGANGWYRTASRTGQDVKLICDYVDVICPMFYPSHFDQNFLNFEPYEERPYRIYYYGSYRTFFMTKKRTLIRPYIQHFKLNVSYDRLYFGTNYILNEIRGVEEGLNMGYTFWNALGNY